MKFSTFAIFVASAAAQWWDGSPECAHSCLSSFYQTASATAWPTPAQYCTSASAAPIASCLSSACSATPTAYSSYSSLSSSLCSRYASCTSAGSTGVYTYTWPTGTASAPGPWSGRAGKKYKEDWGGWGRGDGTVAGRPWSEGASGTATWTGGPVTVTGCGAWSDSPWYSGPGGSWGPDGGFGGWIGWGKGWSYGPTATATITLTSTASGGSVITTKSLATVAQAVSGNLTLSSTLIAAQETGGATSTPMATPNAAAGRPGLSGSRASEGSVVMLMAGFALGAVLLVAGML